MKVFVSNVCRIDGALIAAIAAATALKPGVNAIPEGTVLPRQLRITEPGKCGNIAATLKAHRGSMIATISRNVANELVRDRVAAFEPQSLLCYSMSDYLADADVQADADELARAQDSDADIVVVAMIGESRSPLAVCRNIVSGCQKPERLVDDAKSAIAAHDVFLIE